MDRRPWVESVPGAGFREFLERDLAASAPAGVEVARGRRRPARAALRVREAPRPGREGRRREAGGVRDGLEQGRAAERIRPLVDPTAMAVGSDLPMRISWSDSADIDARIVARQVSAGLAQVAATQKGPASSRSPRRQWQVEIHRAK
jgi:hypothetical protein